MEDDACPSSSARAALPGAGPGSHPHLLGQEGELIAYYERLMAVARVHGKVEALRDPFPYFAVGPVIIGSGEALASFPWTDDVLETVPVLEALAAPGRGAHGLLLDDQDQGWRTLVIATGDAACFVEWNGEGPPPADGGWAVDAVSLARQADEALARLRTTHGHLVRALGHDHWSHQREPPRPRPPRP